MVLRPGVRRVSVTAMHWFRSRSRLGSYLALFALAFQLALTVGHVHLDGGVAGFRHSSILTDVWISIDAIATTAPDPANHKAPAHADNYCAACALIHLAGSFAPADPPSLPLPSVFGRLTSEAAVAFDLAAPQRARFAARAPPTA
jgi:hypothetical protein